MPASAMRTAADEIAQSFTALTIAPAEPRLHRGMRSNPFRHDGGANAKSPRGEPPYTRASSPPSPFTMAGYLVRRFLQMIPTLLGVVLFVFALFKVVGDDPAEILA